MKSASFRDDVVWVNLDFGDFIPSNISKFRNFIRWQLDKDIFPVEKCLCEQLTIQGPFTPEDARKIRAWLETNK